MLRLTKNKQGDPVVEGNAGGGGERVQIPLYPADAPLAGQGRGPELYGQRRPRWPNLPEMEAALDRPVTAPPAPLSDEARKLISKAEIKQATDVCDALRALAASRILSHDEWATGRRKQLVEDGERIDAWCNDYLAEVTREQEERARRTVRDREIFETNVAMLEKHGMPLPPPKPAQPMITEQGGEHGAEDESKE